MKFRKSPHRTEKSLRHAQKPANPRSANPCGPESTSVTPGKDPPMATPPQGRKMAPERPFPILIETGKSYPKTGLLPAVSRRFSDSFASGLPAVSRRFPTVLPGFPGGFAGGFPAVFPAVFSASSTPFSDSFPAVFRQVRRRLDSHFPATRFPWINPPVRLRPIPFIRKKRQETSAIPYTLSRLQTQHSGIF